MNRFITSAAIVVLAFASVVAGPAPQAARPFTIDELISVRRVAEPQVSPDGKWIAYTIADTDKAANKRTTQIYLLSIDGGEPRQLTSAPQSSSSPRWSPDGKKLAFISARDGAPQIWTLDVASGEQKKVSAISTGADGPVWSPDGRMLAFASDIYPDCASDDCNRER
ncbi:MAG TPA: S9 family peptidase, partial [Blastocatellia bacterium]|nr:S9 family peptidase [Blastocatellia bacterium]